MSAIVDIAGREILDSRGNPTVEVDVTLEDGTTMTAEFEGLNRAFGWDEDDFAELNKTALDAAFTDADTKARIAKKLEPAP